ncbi:NnrS protein involved in response to NO [hydrothermal vent metagenome]|uniref:NnrS protein involved in response to NO n=1 Tax=hydrothermal vent metagenome TaxID=652676 RepID=A0A3B0X0P0_9ZZZZ
MLNIEGQIVDSKPENFGSPILRLGFRPFFLAAGVFSILSMVIWMASYVFSVEIVFSGVPPNLWHAHEMLFGYVMAVVAGFLLTAIKNWTGEEVLRGKALAFLFLLWALARLLPLLPSVTALTIPIEIIALLDVSFLFLLALACLRPVLKIKQYKQAGIISKLFLLMLCNVAFYLGVMGVLAEGVQWGLYSALYMVIALIFVMLRRVMPMFIKNGVDGDVTLVNRAWLDYSSLVLLVCLWISDVFTSFDNATTFFAVLLALLHTLRLAGWYTNKIWYKPLVWILVLAYAAFIFGFVLKALSITSGVSPFLSVHAFTVGGIGLLTIGMMSRVSLGHTGRNVFEPPAMVFWSFIALVLSFIFRVILPLLNMELYIYWIGISQVLWIIAFGIFVYVYAPMFLSARIDGRDG